MPRRWVKHFTKDEFGDCFGGGLWAEPHPSDPNIMLAQYGLQGFESTVGKNCLFKIDMSTLTMSLFTQLPDNTDAHGLQFCRTTGGDLRVINTNRQTSTLDVIDYSTGALLLEGYDMNAEVFDNIPATWLTEAGKRTSPDILRQGQKKKLQPDVVYLHNDFLYIAARGPRPISVVKAQNFYENAHPGLMAMKIDAATCLPAADQTGAFIVTALERSPEVTSDVHVVWGVPNGGNMEIWVLDQAGTGSVQTYQVWSACAALGAPSVHADPPDA